MPKTAVELPLTLCVSAPSTSRDSWLRALGDDQGFLGTLWEGKEGSVGPLQQASLIGPRPAESQEKAAAAAEGFHGNSRRLCSLGLELVEEEVGDGRKRKSQRKGRREGKGEEEKKTGEE